MERFKPITEEIEEYIDKQYTAYLFYTTLENKDRYYECSRCRQSGIVPKIKRTEREADRTLERARHNDKAMCPFCGTVCTLKNNSIAKKRLNLWEERRFVLVETTEAGEVLLRALDTWKGYANIGCRPHIEEKKRFILYPGGYEVYKKDFYDRWNHVKKSRSDAFDMKPFTSAYYADYDFIMLGRLKSVDFMRYHSLHEYLALVEGETCAEDRTVRYLCEYAKHPRLEMLVKCGLASIVKELVWYGKKHKSIIDWNAKTPRGALYLTKPEYKTLMKAEDKYRYIAVECLHHWRKVNPKAKIENAITICEAGIYQDCRNYLEKYVFTLDIPVKKILQINDRRREFWRDYIQAAEKLGYDLKNPVVVFPKDLKEAHDTAISAVSYKVNREMEEMAKKTLAERRKKYNFESGDFLIRIAETMQEIIDEGKKMHHCVGGYAERHMKDQTTILFVRRADDPETPLCAVEWRQGKIWQAYCFKNTDPPPEIKAFLAEWLGFINKNKVKEDAGALAASAA